jgi:hypothetical protein
MRLVPALTAAAALLLISAPAPAGHERIELTVTEPAGVERRAEPVRGGLPLPRGVYDKDQPFALRDADGEAVPCQVSPLVVDEQGKLRWVLLDFQTDLNAGATRRFSLVPGRATATAEPKLQVRRTDAGVTVDTGATAFTVSNKAPFSLLTTASAAGKPVVTGGSASYTDALTGETYRAGSPTRIEVNYAGPMRVTLTVRGGFVGDDKTGLGYIARITAWAGRSDVHVKYSLANSNPDHYCWRLIRDSRIELKLAGRVRESLLGGTEPIEAGPRAELVATLRTEGRRAVAGACRAYDGGKEVWASEKGEPAAGWLAARLPDRTVWACDLHFAANPARRLGVEDGRLILGGVMQRPADEADAKAAPYRHRSQCLPDCSHLSSEYVIDLAAPHAPDALVAAGRRAYERLWVFATPEWYLHRAAGALPHGRFGTQKDEMAAFEAWGWRHDPKDAPRAPRGRCDFGRFFRGIRNHRIAEADVLDHNVLMYLRTGSRPYFNNARTWAAYAMDTYAWRTDGWRWKDGGVWWTSGGPVGNRPVRDKDPLTGTRHYVPAPWSKKLREPWTKDWVADNHFLTNSKSCYCHNWAAGLVTWYLLTGQVDALESAVDRVEQDHNTFVHARQAVPGKHAHFKRSFTRGSYNAHALRVARPRDAYVRETSEYFAALYLRRPKREPRGLVNGPVERLKLGKGGLVRLVGEEGLRALKRSGNRIDLETGVMTDPDTGHTWRIIHNPHIWMLPPLSKAMSLYHEITGDEDAMDWTIAYGQAAAHLIFQDHLNLTYGRMLCDFPRRGVCKDYASWVIEPGNKYAEGLELSGYLARFHPDVCARAYSLCGEERLRKRAFQFWAGGSHRDYHSDKMAPLDRVHRWLDFHSVKDGQIDFAGRTIYVWGAPREDRTPPTAVKDLRVRRRGQKAVVSFTPPVDLGGRVARYQVKCSDRPIVEYETFLNLFNEFKDDAHCNWWMATNLSGEPEPGRTGQRITFTVTGVPAGARYFAVRSFDDSHNRSGISNIAGSGR